MNYRHLVWPLILGLLSGCELGKIAELYKKRFPSEKTAEESAPSSGQFGPVTASEEEQSTETISETESPEEPNTDDVENVDNSGQTLPVENEVPAEEPPATVEDSPTTINPDNTHLYVSHIGSDLNPGNQKLPLKSLEKALNIADTPTVMIHLSTGKFNWNGEKIKISERVKNLSIVGESIIQKDALKPNDRDTTIIDYDQEKALQIDQVSFQKLTISSEKNIVVNETSMTLAEVELQLNNGLIISSGGLSIINSQISCSTQKTCLEIKNSHCNLRDNIILGQVNITNKSEQKYNIKGNAISCFETKCQTALSVAGNGEIESNTLIGGIEGQHVYGLKISASGQDIPATIIVKGNRIQGGNGENSIGLSSAANQVQITDNKIHGGAGNQSSLGLEITETALIFNNWIFGGTSLKKSQGLFSQSLSYIFNNTISSGQGLEEGVAIEVNNLPGIIINNLLFSSTKSGGQCMKYNETQKGKNAKGPLLASNNLSSCTIIFSSNSKKENKCSQLKDETAFTQCSQKNLSLVFGERANGTSFLDPEFVSKEGTDQDISTLIDNDWQLSSNNPDTLKNQGFLIKSDLLPDWFQAEIERGLASENGGIQLGSTLKGP